MEQANNRLVFVDKYIFNTFIFKLLMVIATLFTAIPFVHFQIGGYLKYILAYGLVTCAWSALRCKFKNIFSNRISILLILFWALYLITIIINRQYSFTENLSQWVYMGAFFFAFCILDSSKTAEVLKREFTILAFVFILITFIFSCISFYMYIRGISGTYTLHETVYYYGMFQNRLWGLYNPNIGSELCIISMLSSIYLQMEYKSKTALKILLTFNIIIQFFCYLLASSRGTTIAFLIAICLFAGLYYSNKLTTNNKKVVSAALAVIVMLAIIGTSYIVDKGLAYLPSLVNSSAKTSMITGQISSNITVNKLEINLEKENIERPYEIENDITSGRSTIWKTGFKVFKASPLLGVSNEGIYDVIVNNSLLPSPESFRANAIHEGGLHNAYLEILVASGIVGFIIFIAIVISTIIVAIKNKESTNYLLKITLPSILLFFLATGVIEAQLLYRVGILNVVFWINLGYIANFQKDFHQKVVKVSEDNESAI